MVSVTSRTDGRGGKMYSFCAWYSLRMSFWIVPARSRRSTPDRSAAATYIASRIAAGPFTVMEVETCDMSMPAKRSSTSRSVSTATPARPTSPRATELSESRPMSVGMSNAVDSPVPPAPSSSRKRALVSSAVPNPANMRIVQSRDLYIEG
jgi:hypothetical protein